MKIVNNLLLRTMLLLLLTAAALVANGQTQFWVNGIHYETHDLSSYEGMAVISVRVIGSNNNEYSGEITIPPVINTVYTTFYGETCRENFVVDEIGYEAFRGCTGLTGITIPYTVKTIGTNAFYGCSNLTRVTLANGLKEIGGSAFSYCTALTDIVLPNSVYSLGSNAFYNCTSLTNVTLPTAINSLTSVFPFCTSLTQVTIPSGVRSMYGTFKGCSALTTVNLNQSITEIGSETFYGCSSLTNIYIPNSVGSIQSSAFMNCGLTSLELPSTISSVGSRAFEGCNSLTSVTSRRLSPPSVSYNYSVFSSETFGLATLYVPETSLSQYSAVSPWKLFENIQGLASLNNNYDFVVDGIAYLITGDNTVEVTYKETKYEGNINIPSTVVNNGVTYQVKGIGSNAFNNCIELGYVTLPEGLTYIANRAFYYSGLARVTLPSTLTSISSYAFYGCGELTSITIPENVTSIGISAFELTYMTSLTWNARECWTKGGMPANNFSELVIGDGVEVLPERLAYDSPITSVTLPASLRCIGDEAFYNATGLTSLTIPENVKFIGDNAFYCPNLQTLTWNARECWSLGYTGSLNVYDLDSFWPSLTEVNIGNEVEVIPSYFVCSSDISSITIPSTVKHIGPRSFACCDQLRNVVIPDGVESVGAQAFAYCTLLNDFTMGRDVTTVGSQVLYMSNVKNLTWNARRASSGGYDCYELRQVTFGNEVEIIPDRFAADCRVKTIDIPASVISIGADAFSGCTQLDSLTLRKNLATIGPGAFNYCTALKSLMIPGSVTSIGKNAFRDCKRLESIVVESDNEVYDSRDNCNAVIHTATDSLVLTCKNTVLPSGITAIPDYAFYERTDLTSFDIPNTVVSIGQYAFADCSNLQSLYIPASVAYIGEGAYQYCTGLQSIEVDEGNSVYDSRDNSNALIKTADNALIQGCRNTVIPSSIESIGRYAFIGCSNLTSINIPVSVDTVEYAAFGNCSGLTRVDITDLAAWCNIGFNESSSNPLSFARHLYVNGNEPTEVVIPSSVSEIKPYSFYTCWGMQRLVLNNNVKRIGYYAFYDCLHLTKVTIPNSVEYIDSYAFAYCSDVTSITIGSGVKRMGYNSFYISYYSSTMGNDGPKLVTCLATTPPSINSSTFSSVTYGGTLRVPEASVNAYKTAYYWKNFANIEGIPGAGPGDVNADGRITVKDVTTLIEAIMNGGMDVLENPYVDVNGDGVISISDITMIINMMLNGDKAF